MNKGLIGFLIAIIVIIVAIGGIAIYRKSNTNIDNNNIGENIVNGEQGEAKIAENINNEGNTNIANTVTNNTETKNKTLVVYYSAQNHTKTVAEKIAKNLNADTFEIIPEEVYTSNDLNWNDSNSRVSREHNDESLRNVKLTNTKVDNWEDYDTVLIGYPIWWGIAAWPVDGFVKANDFEGKTVIPFCTSASSGLGQSGKLLEQEANSGNWLEGHRFSSSASDAEIQEWTNSLK